MANNREEVGEEEAWDSHGNILQALGKTIKQLAFLEKDCMLESDIENLQPCDHFQNAEGAGILLNLWKLSAKSA